MFIQLGFVGIQVSGFNAIVIGTPLILGNSLTITFSQTRKAYKVFLFSIPPSITILQVFSRCRNLLTKYSSIAKW